MAPPLRLVTVTKIFFVTVTLFVVFLVTVTDNVIAVTVTKTRGDFMKLRCISSGLGVETGSVWPVLQETKSYWIVVICGVEKKVIKSTRVFAGAPKNGPAFEPVFEFPTATDTESVTVTETVKRKPGRPVTGKALSPAAKQAAYRLRQRQKAVTVTISRGLLEYLDAQMLAIMEGRTADLISPEQAEELHTAIRRASIVQLPPVDGEPREP